jgi:hypothetical protein
MQVTFLWITRKFELSRPGYEKLEEILQQHEHEVRGILDLEKVNLQKYLTDEVSKVTQLKCTFLKIEKYIKRFNRELSYFKSS